MHTVSGPFASLTTEAQRGQWLSAQYSVISALLFKLVISAKAGMTGGKVAGGGDLAEAPAAQLCASVVPGKTVLKGNHTGIGQGSAR